MTVQNLVQEAELFFVAATPAAKQQMQSQGMSLLRR
jgi:hypothetical protein